MKTRGGGMMPQKLGDWIRSLRASTAGSVKFQSEYQRIEYTIIHAKQVLSHQLTFWASQAIPAEAQPILEIPREYISQPDEVAIEFGPMVTLKPYVEFLDWLAQEGLDASVMKLSRVNGIDHYYVVVKFPEINRT